VHELEVDAPFSKDAFFPPTRIGPEFTIRHLTGPQTGLKSVIENLSHDNKK
jgi:hypothetical protein